MRCSGAHEFKDCPGKDIRNAVEARCANCKGSHSAAFRECKGYVEVREALKIVTKEKLSYKEALMKVRHVQKGVQPAAPKVVRNRSRKQERGGAAAATANGTATARRTAAAAVQQQRQQAQQSPGPRRKLVFQAAPTASPSAEPIRAKSASSARTKAVMIEKERWVQQIFRAMLGVVDAYIPIQSNT